MAEISKAKWLMKHATVNKEADLYQTPLEELKDLQKIAENRAKLLIRETNDEGHITNISIDIKDGKLIPFYFPFLRRLHITYGQVGDFDVNTQLCELNFINEHLEITQLGLFHLCLDEFPDICQLNKLEVLSLMENKITKLEGLENLVNIEKLWLNHNRIKKIVDLKYLQNLKELHISINSLKNFDEIPPLENVELIDARDNMLDTINIDGGFPNLKELILRDNHLQQIRGIHNLPKLEKLNLQENRIKVLENISNVPNIKYIFIAQTYIDSLGDFDIPAGSIISYFDERSIKGEKREAIEQFLDERGIIHSWDDPWD